MEYTQEFNDLWEVYPKRAGCNPKKLAYKKYQARLKEGVSHQDLMDNLCKYRVYCQKTDRIGTEYVLQAATYFGPNEYYLEEWILPKELSTPEWTKIPRDNEQLWPWAREHGFSSPGSMTYSQYRRKLENEVEQKLKGQQ